MLGTEPRIPATVCQACAQKQKTKPNDEGEKMKNHQNKLTFELIGGGVSHLQRNGAGTLELDFDPVRINVEKRDESYSLTNLTFENFLSNNFLVGDRDDGVRIVIPLTSVRSISTDRYSPAGRSWTIYADKEG